MTTPTHKTIPLDQIRLDGETQPRAEINQAIVSEYADEFLFDAALPPIIVFYDGATYWLADGFHRWHGAKKAGLVSLKCRVRLGSLDEARWWSYSANQTHGLRRTNDDKRKAVLAALSHPNGAGLSNGALAEHVGAHIDTVAKYRREVEGDLPKTSKSDARLGKDGRTIDTAAIGASKACQACGESDRNDAGECLACLGDEVYDAAVEPEAVLLTGDQDEDLGTLVKDFNSVLFAFGAARCPSSDRIVWELFAENAPKLCRDQFEDPTR